MIVPRISHGRSGVGTGSAFELLEGRRLMSAAVSGVNLRSFDGTRNNVAHPGWGSNGADLLRLAPAAYADGVSAPAGANRPSARVVSNTVAAHPSEEMPNARHMSAFVYLWGQFIDHDLDLTNAASPAQAFDVAVPKGDAYFDPKGTGTQTIPLSRSEYDPATGATSARQQVNSISAFIDGSMVYGNTPERAAALREFVGGRMKTSAGDLLPWNTMGVDNATVGGPADGYFAAGDVRANENVELTAIQTLFVREHNRIAADIAKRDPTLSDEAVYQQARRTVIAEIQAITYNEFLPALTGVRLAPYAGYKPSVNPGIANEFSTAAFRLGHSLLADDVEFLDNDGVTVREEISLAEAFFNPKLLTQTGIDPLMKYLATSNAEEVDTKVVDSLRNFLFGPPGAGGLDLASLNVQRGRDHGLADYNATRRALGLKPVTRFEQITSDAAVQQQLRQLYGTVDNVDLWVGGLAEDHVAGSSLGPTFQKIVLDQFTRLRDGDRFWYQRDLGPQQARAADQTTLADVIRRNTTVSNVQENVFVFNVRLSGSVFADGNGNGRADRGERGLGGFSVQLMDAGGGVVGTATTGADGLYAFEGLEAGTSYTLAVLPRGGFAAVGAATRTFNITRGIEIDHVDFAERATSVQPPPQPPRPMVVNHEPRVRQAEKVAPPAGRSAGNDVLGLRREGARSLLA